MKQSIQDLILFIILLGVVILIGWKLGEVINQLINEIKWGYIVNGEFIEGSDVELDTNTNN